MNACVADNPPASEVRRASGIERSALEQKLNDWGDWLEARLDIEGYPQSDAVAAALDGAGGGAPGHRVLFPFMPFRLYSIHTRILRLPDHEHAAVVVWYVPAIHVETARQYIVQPIETVLEYPLGYPVDRTVTVGVRYGIYERGGKRFGAKDGYCSRAIADNKAGAMTRADARTYGSPWTTPEKAQRLGITEDALYQRLHRARQRLLGILPLFGVDPQSEVK
jgi:hypothetical protein